MWNIDSETGAAISQGIQSYEAARSAAQAHADRTGTTPTVYDPADPRGTAENVSPRTVTVSITTSSGAPSTCVDDAGAQDYDVTITVGDRSVSGEATLCVDHQGHLSSWGSLDNWLSSDLARAVRSLDRDESRAVARHRLIEAIVSACIGDVETVEVKINVESITDLARQGAIDEVEEYAEDVSSNVGDLLHRTGEYNTDPAINAAAHEADHISSLWADVYYAAWGAAGAERVRELVSEAAEQADA